MRKETDVFQQSVNSGIKHSFTLVVADREEKVVLLTEVKRDRSPINIEATKIRLELKSHTPFSYIARHSFSNYEILRAEFVQNIATEFPNGFKNVTEQLKIWNIQIGKKEETSLRCYWRDSICS